MGRGPNRVAIIGAKRQRCAEWWRMRARAGRWSNKVTMVADRVVIGGTRMWRHMLRWWGAGVAGAIASVRKGERRSAREFPLHRHPMNYEEAEGVEDVYQNIQHYFLA